MTTGTEPRPLELLSLGAGVQSTTALLMSLAGDLPPLAGAIFADTGWEPAAVYEHLGRLETVAAAAGVPVHRVGKPVGIREAALDPATRFASIPAFYANDDGSTGRGKRQCTNEFKIEPIRSLLWKLHREAGRPGIRQWFGISWDEAQRMRDSDARYIDHHYPLIDLRMTRRDCLAWLAEAGWETPRSACIGCPFHSDAEWRRIRDNDPAAWADAVDFDARIRHGHGLHKTAPAGRVYLHRQRVPLDEADLRTVEQKGQGSMFPEFADDDCDTGYCGR